MHVPTPKPYNRKWFLMDVGIAGIGANAAWDAGKSGYSHWDQHRNQKPYPTTKTHQFKSQ